MTNEAKGNEMFYVKKEQVSLVRVKTGGNREKVSPMPEKDGRYFFIPQFPG